MLDIVFLSIFDNVSVMFVASNGTAIGRIKYGMSGSPSFPIIVIDAPFGSSLSIVSDHDILLNVKPLAFSIGILTLIGIGSPRVTSKRISVLFLDSIVDCFTMEDDTPPKTFALADNDLFWI